jgi:AcrR family transcriptional regulator
VSDPLPPADTEDDLVVARRVHTATLDLLARAGLPGLTVAAVAAEAGLAPQAVAARWPTPAALATAAVTSLDATERPLAGRPFDVLVAELLAYRRVMAHPAAAALAAEVLAGRDAELVRLTRDRVLRAPRLRLRRVLEQARADGQLDADDAAIDLAVSSCTGSWFGLAVAGLRPPRDWGPSLARLTWRSLGGTPPA